MRRALVLPFLLATATAAACPTCAGSQHSPNVWPIVGVFLLVPPLIALGVLHALRKELGRPGSEGADEGRVLPFARRP